ncbi:MULTISPECIES: type II toxin-antitoxin system VapC family toxin [Sphingomonas]|uniref:Ribonuclease VapC n=1 Tax=Sphingomonas glacialis TaxID=658225 RepID=A0ABQ3LP34_9SPHN|nr:MULTISPECIES: type II toxin-antitoxin system VapC family toxin [Sphingomonas]GHH22231.1 twitching motility protein PilT [Sphingomonas glacialis]
MILFDTHVLIWFADGDPRLGKVAGNTVADAIGSGEALFAAISMWEIGMLVARRNVTLAMPPEIWIERLVEVGLVIADMTRQIALDAGSLPREIHGDPCDRIIMATARAYNCPLLTADTRLLDYGREGRLKAIDARR